ERGFFTRLRLWYDILFDVIVSLPQVHRRRNKPAFAAGPVFHILADNGPRRGALVLGAALSVLVFNVVHVAMMSGGGLRPMRGSLFGAGFFQTRGLSKSVFEVVSVKPNTSPGATQIAPPIGGRFLASNATLRTLVRLAFRYEDDSRILGGPA